MLPLFRAINSNGCVTGRTSFAFGFLSTGVAAEGVVMGDNSSTRKTTLPNVSVSPATTK